MRIATYRTRDPQTHQPSIGVVVDGQVIDAHYAYARYLSDEYVTLTGSATEIRAAADAWGVTYARVETGSAAGYAMAHTADTFLVDPAGRLVARYPFGTEAGAIVHDLAALASAASRGGVL